MRKIKISVIMLIVIPAFAAVCFADFTFDFSDNASTYDQSGVWLGTIVAQHPGNPSGNDKINYVDAIIDAYFSYDFTGLYMIHKFEFGETTPADYEPEPNETFVETGFEDVLSGEWTTTGEPVLFYSIKAGQQSAVYWLNPAATTGTWTTSVDLDEKGTSHISFWSAEEGPQAVPEPMTAILLASGLAGIAYTRKRFRKTNLSA